MENVLFFIAGQFTSFLVYLALRSKQDKVQDKLNVIRKITSKRCQILMPKTDDQIAVEQIIERNDFEGKPTHLFEIRS